MTQLGEGHGGGQGVGAPVGGELLAERYQLDQHVNTDRVGRQIWRGVDVILRRPVAVLVQYPGGPGAEQLLRTAVQASRIVHPNLVGVYDAIDEQTRAYVVREWIDGVSLRDHVTAGPLDPRRAVAVAASCAAAVTAVHAAGLSHGNIHPGTLMVDADGRVVLTDAHSDGTTPFEDDLRAIGGVLYYALTGYWPHAEVVGPANLPDAVRDGAGALASPRQVLAGVPAHLDNLTMDLLDRRIQVPPADVLAGELARLDAGGDPPDHAEPAHAQPGGPEHGTGPIRFANSDGVPKARPTGRRLALGLGGLLVAGVIGLLVGLTWLTGASPETGPAGSGNPAAGGDEPGTGSSPPDASDPTPIALTADQVRVVDPDGNRSELDGIEQVVDGDLTTGWQTEQYTRAAFGDIKPGMGILIDLGEPRHVASVRVEFEAPGATAEIRVGDRDPGNSSAGDDEIYQTYQPVGEPKQGGTTMVFSAFDQETTYRYVMVWLTELPPVEDGYQVGVQQVAVEGY